MTANDALPRKRLKYFVDRKTQKAPVERGSHYVGLENVEPWTGRYLPTEAEIETESSQFRCGDVLFGKLRPYLAKVYVAQADGTCTSEMLVLRPREGVLKQFLFYRLVSADFIDLVNSTTFGSKMPRADWEQIGNLSVALPAPNEQARLVSLLDRQTSEIDALIAKKQRLIDLLDEKHDLLINRAVTAGLKLSAPVKNSGQPLLGDLPVHWCVKRTKFLFAYVTSGSRGWAEHYSETGPVFLRITNVTRDGIDLYTGDLQRVSVPEGSEGERTRASAGDLVISITAWVGAVGIVPEGLGEAYVSQHLALCRPNTGINSRWLAYALFALPMRCQFNQMMYGGTKVQLALGDVKNISVPVPPPDEQNAIATHLDALTRNTRKVKSAILSAIDRLREYRSALITAAVNGQLDVREHEKKMEALV